jgi:hypothetical protein
MAEGLARGRQRLVIATGQDFGYDLRAWNEYLIKNGKRRNSKRRAIDVESRLADPDWQAAARFAEETSLLERLVDRDHRRREAQDQAEREWSGKLRPCSRCATVFRSVQDRGQCPACGHGFFASHPDSTGLWWLEIE